MMYASSCFAPFLCTWLVWLYTCFVCMYGLSTPSRRRHVSTPTMGSLVYLIVASTPLLAFSLSLSFHLPSPTSCQHVSIVDRSFPPGVLLKGGPTILVRYFN
ncbi:uncharacterized protein GGS25DRAFT_308801 [Hypoxylon fragiforme]|uniref:uncharacterized protein n=1 Tax=Hypoxylon fragiforme TaxID=63214 RepID=UPI0020C62C71|nr:uncharacterized protein GGS25DRAFT_308801 [Hypoxylon fragiforme]KAI2606849.1 hypothetical protein GGS25DRAFT_308801 [Hypoxylon fragiforme]